MKLILKNKSNFFAKNQCEILMQTILVCTLYSIKYAKHQAHYLRGVVIGDHAVHIVANSANSDLIFKIAEPSNLNRMCKLALYAR